METDRLEITAISSRALVMLSSVCWFKWRRYGGRTAARIV